MPSVQSSIRVRFHFLAKARLPSRTFLKFFIEKLFLKEKTKLASLTYVFCTDQYLLDINRTYLQHDDYTDIITFDLSEPNAPTTGEIYISIDRVRENAIEYKRPFKEELLRVIFHGALHLCGYKDKSPKAARLMRSMEEKYLSMYFRNVSRGTL